MKMWNGLALRLKLALLYSAMMVAALVALGSVGYTVARQALVDQVYQQLESVAQAQSNALSRLITNTEETMRLYASDRGTAIAIRDFAKAFASYEDPTAELQRLYITENPFPAGERDQLDKINAMEPYHITHRRLHPTFNQLQDSLGLYDVFLFDDQGNLLYSVFKEVDFATNFQTGPWADTTLAEAYSAAMALPRGAPPILVDFQPYGPSADTPAAFMALPIYFSDENPIGVLAFQMPVQRMQAAIAGFAGVGDTGNVQVYGADGLLRFDGNAPDRSDVLRAQFPGSIEGAERPGEASPARGPVSYVDDQNRARLGFAYPASFLGATWLVVASKSQDEGLAPVRRMRQMFGATGLGLALLSALAAWITGKNVARPLVAMGGAVRRLEHKDFSHTIPHADRGDEVGNIAAFLEKLRGSLATAEEQNHIAHARGTAFMGSSSAMMVISMNNVVELVNDAMVGLALTNSAALQAIDPDFDASQMPGRKMAVLALSEAIVARMQDIHDTGVFETILPLQGISMGIKLAPILGEDNRATGMVVEWTDKTEELLNQEMLADQVRIEFDIAGRIVFANENAKGLLGGAERAWLSGAGLAARCNALDIEGPGQTDVLNLGRTGQKYLGRFSFDLPDGPVIVDGTMLPVRNQDGDVTRIVLQATDRTQDHLRRQEANDQRAHALAAQQTIVEKLSEALQSLASCDLTTRILDDLGADYEEVRENFNSAIATLDQTIATVSVRANQVSESARGIQDSATNLSSRTEAQAVNLEETVSALQELTGLVQATTKNASQTAEIVAQARNGAKDSGVIVTDAIAAMDAIEQGSGEIRSIINVIEEIAFQTNLLALNAGVEAARAGEAGRGFAVVASEVRALAQKSSDAAREIAGLIAANGSQIQNGVEMVSKAGGALEAISKSVTEINSKMDRIAQDATSQSNSINEISAAIQEMDQLASQNAAMFEETTAATADLSQLAHELDGLTSQFTTVAARETAPDGDPARLAG